jgi:hypothetical protein
LQHFRTPLRGIAATFYKICIVAAVATWRHNKNNLLVAYGLARDTELSFHQVAATPTVAAKIGQPEFLPPSQC